MAKKIKESLLNKIKDSGPEKYELTEWEAKFVESLDLALKTSIYHDQLLGGIFNYISQQRLGLPEAPAGQYWRYMYDLDDDTRTLTVELAKQGK